jgi:hypothetical protein
MAFGLARLIVAYEKLEEQFGAPVTEILHGDSPREWVALLSLRIGGRERVARHAELAMLAKLSCALMGEGAIHPAA